ncbi:aminoglycoside N(3)-acetyltransferase [Paenibacillus sp. Leaf72]|uniref:aminoglycoside N(3)-acetyltransferase n=1 Tax=Paenibacillus sp. Leaf72 TaxID=1736234 RepID=UPI0006FB3DE0|nr:AAC(3) family N-acetyltransferase [Paenibacillus sp. Leaf72]KQO12067.1 aminoglycoside 3-N-acetyltransferase [Paenibacillus sp. Leaf72]
MREQQLINSQKRPITINNIVQDLRRLGVREGDSVLVHASLSRLGWVCGGPQAMVQALMQAVGDEGTLIMPAQSGDWSDPAEWGNPPVPEEWYETIYRELPAFDPALSPTRGMGRIAELFRTFPATVRSAHPQVSFCANGKYAELITSEHMLSPQFGMASPLGKLYGLGAKVLMLGTGYESCTSFHLAEAMSERLPTKQLGTAIYEGDERVWKWFTDFAYDSADFAQIGQCYDYEGSVQKGAVGSAECRLFDLKEAVDFAKQWLMIHRSME